MSYQKTERSHRGFGPAAAKYVASVAVSQLKRFYSYVAALGFVVTGIAGSGVINHQGTGK